MPSFSRQLEESLHRAVAYANQRKHEYATLEHLLLSLIDDEDAAGVMRACDVELGALRTTLTNYVDNELRSLVVDDQRAQLIVHVVGERGSERAELDIAGAHHAGGVFIVDQAEEQVLQGGIFMLALVRVGDGAMQGFFELARK